jgi:hypothetical protein
MRDWNVLVTVNTNGWNAALRLLRSLGRVAETRFYNVLLVHADDPRVLLGALEDRVARDAAAVACLARVAMRRNGLPRVHLAMARRASTAADGVASAPRAHGVSALDGEALAPIVDASCRSCAP